ncbi:cell division protein PerM [Microbacterium jejuense]|uniref:cell division protein PerM n=1 Tax=Microbacterium jejuense TaxID=1263637 RepID=UPI0031E92AF1
MHRLIVALLSAVDAAIAAAVGLAATLAPLTLLWVFGFGGGADWGVLWHAGVSVWQLGNLVPLHITLPPEYLAATGIDASAASFVLSLAPLAFATFTAIFAARSGARASHADAWIVGVVTSTAVFGALTTVAAFTGANEVAGVARWQAILFPTLVFALPAVLAALVTEWREAGSGAVARVRDRVEAQPHGWSEAPALIARGGAVTVTGLVGAGALVLGVSLFARAGQIVALFQASSVDPAGSVVITLGQLAYLPTLVVWALAFVAGPGFAVGTGTAVSPAGTQVGVLPGIPALGVVPESTTTWLLLLALIPVGIGALAGWIARSRLVGPAAPRAGASVAPRPQPASSRFDDGRTAALSGLLSASGDEDPDAGPEDVEPDAGRHGHDGDEPIAARLVIALGIAVVSAAAAALLSFAASGSLGPGRLSEFGPQPGPVALAVGIEVLIGAAILLLAPVGRTGAQGSGGLAASTSPQPAERDDADIEADAGADEPQRIPDLDDTADLAAIAAAWSSLRAVPGPPAPTRGGDAARREPPGEATTEPIDLPPAP